jgi:hypothetical protein
MTPGARLLVMLLRALTNAALVAIAGPAPAADGDPQFAIVNWTSPPAASDGTSVSFDEVPCPVGTHPPGVLRPREGDAQAPRADERTFDVKGARHRHVGAGHERGNLLLTPGSAAPASASS